MGGRPPKRADPWDRGQACRARAVVVARILFLVGALLGLAAWSASLYGMHTQDLLPVAAGFVVVAAWLDIAVSVRRLSGDSLARLIGSAVLLVVLGIVLSAFVIFVATSE